MMIDLTSQDVNDEDTVSIEERYDYILRQIVDAPESPKSPKKPEPKWIRWKKEEKIEETEETFEEFHKRITEEPEPKELLITPLETPKKIEEWELSEEIIFPSQKTQFSNWGKIQQMNLWNNSNRKDYISLLKNDWDKETCKRLMKRTKKMNKLLREIREEEREKGQNFDIPWSPITPVNKKPKKLMFTSLDTTVEYEEKDE